MKSKRRLSKGGVVLTAMSLTLKISDMHRSKEITIERFSEYLTMIERAAVNELNRIP